MDAHNPFAGETPFPLAGEGVVIKFTTSDILKLYSLYGPDPREPHSVEPGTNRLTGHFWSTVLSRAETHDPHVLFHLLKFGLKEREGDRLVPLKKPQAWWDDLPFEFSAASDAIVSGVTWSRWGLTPDMLAQRMREEAERIAELEEAGGGPDPQMAMTESPTSFA